MSFRRMRRLSVADDVPNTDPDLQEALVSFMKVRAFIKYHAYRIDERLMIGVYDSEAFLLQLIRSEYQIADTR